LYIFHYYLMETFKYPEKSYLGMQERMPWRTENLPLEKNKKRKRRRKKDYTRLKLYLCAGIGAILTYSGLQIVATVAESTYNPPERQATPPAVMVHYKQEDDFTQFQLIGELDTLPTAEVLQATPTPTDELAEIPPLDITQVTLSDERLDSIWDGQQARPIVYYGETAVIGLDQAIQSREELDEIERNFVRTTFLGFPEELFNPTTIEMGQQIQDIRLENWNTIGDDYERTLEFVVSEETLTRLKDEYGVEDTIAMLLNHADTINEIWDNSSPDIHRQAVIKRIIVVNGDVLSAEGGGWNVVNDTGLGWWANDTLNGVPGFIPYDIDSRWGLSEEWVDLYPFFGDFNDMAVDYGLLHELSHHLPVGDNYVYPPGSGHGFTLAQPMGKTAAFTIYELAFMHNDHMTNNGAENLTAPSSYHIRYFWELNPKHRRTAQMNPYPVREVYGRHFFDRLTIRLEGLADAGIEGCTYMRQNLDDWPEDRPFSVEPSDEHAGIEFTGDACILMLDGQEQADAHPGVYIGLEKDGIVFPVYFPRVLMETLYWKEVLDNGTVPEQYTLTMEFTPYFIEAFEQYAEKIRSGEDEIVGIPPHSLWFYMADLSGDELPENTIAKGDIDTLGNSYILEYKTGHD